LQPSFANKALTFRFRAAPRHALGGAVARCWYPQGQPLNKGNVFVALSTWANTH